MCGASDEKVAPGISNESSIKYFIDGGLIFLVHVSTNYAELVLLCLIL